VRYPLGAYRIPLGIGLLIPSLKRFAFSISSNETESVLQFFRKREAFQSCHGHGADYRLDWSAIFTASMGRG
jgi:hypothetical protein